MTTLNLKALVHLAATDATAVEYLHERLRQAEERRDRNEAMQIRLAIRHAERRAN